MATISWVAAASGDWNTASNWSGGQVPGASDDAVINLPGAYLVTASTAAVQSLTFNNANGELLATGSVSVTGTTAINAGTLAITQSGVVSLGTLTNAGTIIDNGRLSLSTNDANSLTNIGGTGAIVANVTIDNTGGTIDLGAHNVRLIGSIHGGTLLNAGGLSVAQYQQPGPLTFDGVQLVGTAGIVLDFGTLIVDNGLLLTGPNGSGPGTLFYSAPPAVPGTILFNGNQTLDNGVIHGAGGTMLAEGTLTVGNSMTLTGSPVRFSNSLWLDGPGAVLNFGTVDAQGSGAAVELDPAELDNHGLIEVTPLDGFLAPTSPVSLGLDATTTNNLAGSRIEAGGGAITATSSAFANAGLIQTHTSTISGNVVYSTIEFEQGTIANLAGGVVDSAGGTIGFAAAASLTNSGTIGSSGGSLVIASFLGGAGTTTVQGNGVVEIENVAASAQSIDFTGAGTLTLDQPTFVPSTIDGFSPDDTIRLGRAATAISYSSGDLKMQIVGGQTFDLAITGTHALADFIVNTGSSTTINLACFAAGTRIRTPHGEVPVERLHVGALACVDGFNQD